MNLVSSSCEYMDSLQVIHTPGWKRESDTFRSGIKGRREGPGRPPSFMPSEPIAPSGRNAGQPRSRAIGSEIVDVAAQIDLYMIAFGRCIDAVSG